MDVVSCTYISEALRGRIREAYCGCVVKAQHRIHRQPNSHTSYHRRRGNRSNTRLDDDRVIPVERLLSRRRDRLNP